MNLIKFFKTKSVDISLMDSVTWQCRAIREYVASIPIRDSAVIRVRPDLLDLPFRVSDWSMPATIVSVAQTLTSAMTVAMAAAYPILSVSIPR